MRLDNYQLRWKYHQQIERFRKRHSHRHHTLVRLSVRTKTNNCTILMPSVKLLNGIINYKGTKVFGVSGRANLNKSILPGG